MSAENLKKNALLALAWMGFAAMINAFTKVNQASPLKITVDGRECPVLEVNSQDPTARVETNAGEETIPLQPEHVQALYQKIGREFDLAIPNFNEVDTQTSSAAAGSHTTGAGGYSGA
jgi:hypothetical protein